METKDGHDRKKTVCFLEFLGTSFFLFGIIQTDLAVTIPFILFASVVVLGNITGGHFNPAVTIAMYIVLEEYAKNFWFMISIIISQCLGGIFGIGLAYLGNWGKKGFIATPVTCPFQPTTPQSRCDGQETGTFDMDMNVMTNEVLCTFMFISVILCVKGEHTHGDRKGISAAVAVCATLMGMVACTAKLGGSFNPAVGITATTNAIWQGYREDYIYHYLYAYTLGPTLGGLLAAGFHIFHAKQHKPVDETPTGFDISQRENLLKFEY